MASSTYHCFEGDTAANLDDAAESNTNTLAADYSNSMIIGLYATQCKIIDDRIMHLSGGCRQSGINVFSLFLVDVYPEFTKSPIDIFGTGLNNLLGFDLSHKQR